MDAELINSLADIGFAGGLILILVGGFRGWWLYGPIHRSIVGDLVKDRDFWRNLALGNLRVAERATDALPESGRDDD